MAGRYIWLSVPTMWGSGFSTVMCTWLQAQGIFAPVVALGVPGRASQSCPFQINLSIFSRETTSSCPSMGGRALQLFPRELNCKLFFTQTTSSCPLKMLS